MILPTQLFGKNEIINKQVLVILYEHPVYFTMYKYHKMKLIMHRATLKSYEDYIKKKYKCETKYIEYDEDIKKHIAKKKVKLYDPVDFEVIKSFNKCDCKLEIIDTPQFLTNLDDIKEYEKLNKKDTNRFSQTNFYKWQRTRLNILVNNDGKPEGNKWTYDTENRESFPDNFKTDIEIKKTTNKYIKEAKEYINNNFGDNIGEIDYYLPIDHNGSKKHLEIFLEERLKCYGKYQDAVDKNIIVGCHSIISPLLNIGLLTPEYVINESLEYYKKNKKKIELSSIEGFIRQIIGWREYMRYVYIKKHNTLIKTNHFKHKNKLKKEWFTGKTNIEPIDNIIKKCLKYCYAHHIERLMYIGNFMLLIQTEPKQVHDWFMIMFLDSYHVFMETNVYGMSQYSSGKIMSTRPYFSSSNYILKMSKYKKKDNYTKIILNNKKYEWYEIWDALYYNFIKNNKTEFSKNYAIANAVKNWNKKPTKEKKEITDISNNYIKYY